MRSWLPLYLALLVGGLVAAYLSNAFAHINQALEVLTTHTVC